MAYYDWDNNEKKDLTDDFVEYSIYEETKKDKGQDNDPLAFFYISILPLVLFVMFATLWNFFARLFG